MKYNKVLEHFEAYFGPWKNITFVLNFSHIDRKTFDDYLTKMRELSSDCDLFELREWLLRVMLIIGLNDKSLQERLLREPNLDLTKSVDTCRTVEVTRSHAYAIQYEIRNCSLQHKTQPRTQSSKIISKSKFCLYSHKRGSCPAYGKSCNNCKKKGHFSVLLELWFKSWLCPTKYG